MTFLGIICVIGVLCSAYLVATRKRAPGQPACNHREQFLVDVRSDAFKPNELVATLCTHCDEQLGPEVWQKKLDRELAALDEPAKPKTVVDTAYVRVEPMADFKGMAFERLKRQLEEDIAGRLPVPESTVLSHPKRSWSAIEFRRWGWEPSFKQSNFDHSTGYYVLPLYRSRGERTWDTYKLEFHSEAAAQGWWRSHVAYDHYQGQREMMRQFRLPGRP